MIIFTDDDKKNIARMFPDCTRYCQGPDDVSDEEMDKFMETDG
jgi:hypothetical protein